MGAAASGVQTQMQAEHDPNATFPWWVRFLAKGLGIIGGFVAIFFGVIGVISVHPKCIIAVLLQMASGFLTIALEAPFCCQFVDFIEKIAKFSESRSNLHKALLYALMGVIPIFVCIELETILGSGMIFLCGCAYGFMALGKKADRQTMMAASDPAWSHQISRKVVDFLTKTSAHGLSAIPRATHNVYKLLWLAIWCVFFAAFVVACILLMSRYFSRRKITNVEESSDWETGRCSRRSPGAVTGSSGTAACLSPCGWAAIGVDFDAVRWTPPGNNDSPAFNMTGCPRIEESLLSHLWPMFNEGCLYPAASGRPFKEQPAHVSSCCRP